MTTAGRAFCWGRNYDGQLGVGYFSIRPVSEPTAVVGDLTFASVTAGWSSTCGLTPEAAAYCWGSGSNGQIGNGSSGDTAYYASPQVAAGEVHYASLTTGTAHACGIAVNGSTLCWGSGPLGTDVTRVSFTPVAVSGGFLFRALAAGGLHQCGLTQDGAVYCWGWNASGQLGAASLAEWSDVPLLVALP